MNCFFTGPDSSGLVLTSTGSNASSDDTQFESEGASTPLLHHHGESTVKSTSKTNTKPPPKEAFRLVFPTGAVEDGLEGESPESENIETNDMLASTPPRPPSNDQNHQDQQEVERRERNQVVFLAVILMACVAVVYWWAYSSSTPIKNT